MRSGNILKIPNQGNIHSNLRLLYEMKNAGDDLHDKHGYFTKKDGSIREFWGTTNPSLASKKTVNPIGTEPRLPKGQIPFVDCELGEWRSMRVGSFIGFAE